MNFSSIIITTIYTSSYSSMMINVLNPFLYKDVKFCHRIFTKLSQFLIGNRCLYSSNSYLLEVMVHYTS